MSGRCATAPRGGPDRPLPSPPRLVAPMGHHPDPFAVAGGAEAIASRDAIGRAVGPASAPRSGARGRRGIEDSSHRVRDVVSREAEGRHRAGTRGEELAVLRWPAAVLLKPEGSSRDGLKTERLRCGRDKEYLAKVLAANKVEHA